MGGSIGAPSVGPSFTGAGFGAETPFMGVEPSDSDRVLGKYILRDTLGKGVEGK